MADYTGLAIAVGQVIASLIEVASDMKDAPKDIRELRNELLSGLFTVKGSLQYLPNTSKTKVETVDWRKVAADEMKSLLDKDVQTHPSKLGRTMQYATWHWDKKKVKEHIERVERIKQWLVIATTDGIVASLDDLAQDIRSFRADIDKDRDQRSSEMKQSSHARLLRYLAPLSPERKHEQALSLHEPGTSAWFIEGPLQQFLDTTYDRGSVMWLKGKSGSGKTTLLARSVDHLKDLNPNMQLFYWYCAFDNTDSQQPENFLGDILAKMARKIPGLFDSLVPLMETAEEQGEEPRFQTDQLERILFDNHLAVSSIIIVIDAINESTMQIALERLVHRIAKKCSNVRIIVSSTASPTVPEASNLILKTVEMSEDDLYFDIDLFIKHRLKTEDFFQKLGPDLREEIHKAVLSRSEGMFRYVDCQMRHLQGTRGRGRSTIRQIRHDLLNMPSDLNDLYARILRELRDEDHFKKALLWLCFSQKPLKLNELADLVIIEDGDREMTDQMHLLNPMETIVEQSNGLVVYDARNGIVSLGHSTVKTFLTSFSTLEQYKVAELGIGSEAANHRYMLQTSMTYLSFLEFEDGYGSIDRTTFERHPAIDYISSSWPFYLDVGSPEDWKLIQGFLLTRSSKNAGTYGTWIQMMAANLPPRIVERTEPIYYAAAFGFTPLVEAILRHDDNINLEAPGGRRGSTVLQMSCFRHRKQIARLLLEAGARPFSLDRSRNVRHSSYWWAKQNDGWGDIVELMERMPRQPGEAIGQEDDAPPLLVRFDTLPTRGNNKGIHLMNEYNHVPQTENIRSWDPEDRIPIDI